MIKKIIEFILKLFGISNSDSEEQVIEKENTIYELKPIMTDYERYFYNIMLELNTEYTVIPQLNLASVIKKINNDRYYSELFRNIDFAIFNKDLTKLLLLIEINDNTHKEKSRRERDIIELIKFYSNYPNERNYVLTRIKQILEKKHCRYQ